MYFEKIENLRGAYPQILLRKYDKYLQEVPRAYEDRLQTRIVAKQLNIPIDWANALLEQSCKTGILTKRYIIRCPECGLALKLADEDKLSEAIEETNYCYGCDFGSEYLDLKVETENMEAVYKIIRP